MSHDEIKAAIAEQEEYINRVSSCSGVVGKAHRFEVGEPRKGEQYSRCIYCGVTKTDADYRIKLDYEIHHPHNT